MTRIRDYTKLNWNQESTLDAPLAGMTGIVTGQGDMEEGDEILLCVRCRVSALERYANPPELWRAEVTFIAPESLEVLSEANKFQLVKQLATQLGASIQQSEVYQQVTRLLSSDSVTQLANRAYFNDRLQQEWQRLQREHASLSLILVEVDQAVTYRAISSPSMYNAQLKQIAQTLKTSGQRSTDLVAVYDETVFAVLLPQTPDVGALRVAEMMQSRIQALSPLHKTESAPSMTLSVGVASLVPSSAQTPTDFLNVAEQALQTAKSMGGAKIIQHMGTR
jgi:diguanylate cyclase (GGDEF)-like protein